MTHDDLNKRPKSINDLKDSDIFKQWKEFHKI